MPQRWNPDARANALIRCASAGKSALLEGAVAAGDGMCQV
jgi:hypothetical protein